MKINLFKELSAYKKLFRSPSKVPKQIFMILSRGRSGSELLRSLLNSHPEIYCDGEIFTDKLILSPKLFLKGMAKKQSVRLYGYKAKPFHLKRQFNQISRIKSEFFTPEIKIIYLKRLNILRQAISVQIGNQKNRWHDTIETGTLNKKFVIDYEELIMQIKSFEKNEKREKEFLKNIRYHQIIYENDLLSAENHQTTLDLVFSYLGVNSIQVQTNYIRSTTDHLSDFIKNHDEIISKIKKTDYNRYLE